MKKLFLLALSAAFFLAGCNTKGEPVEFSKACSPENEKKYLEIDGVLAERGGGIFCSNTGGRMECGFALLEAVGSDKKLNVDIEQGSGTNTVDKIERGYKKEDIKIRDNAGNQISLGADKVKVTGKMSVGQNVCFMQVNKIER